MSHSPTTPTESATSPTALTTADRTLTRLLCRYFAPDSDLAWLAAWRPDNSDDNQAERVNDGDNVLHAEEESR